jgi:hypothetical protein
MSANLYSAMGGCFPDGSACGDRSRVNRMGWSAGIGSKEFNTERTEHHGAARRFFGPDRRAFDRPVRHLRIDESNGTPLRHGPVTARPASVAAGKGIQHEGLEECTKNARSRGSRIRRHACTSLAASAPNSSTMNLRAFFVVLHVLRVKIAAVPERIGSTRIPRPTTPDALPRTAIGPVSPCCSVVLRALPVKFLLSQTRIPARYPSREAAGVHNTRCSP